MSAVGFRAQLSGASLWDLVQMECLARARQAVRVTGEGGVGYLYLAEGRVTHAVTQRLSGETAALEILSWTNGSFQPCERAWPRAPSIESSCEALILRAASQRDEQRAGGDERGGSGPSNLVEFPGDIPLGALTVRGEVAGEFSVMLRMRTDGAVVKNHGGSEEAAEALAYVQQLVQLSGELLGLEGFAAMECTFFPEGRWFLFAEDDGDVVALRPGAETDVQPLRERLGL